MPGSLRWKDQCAGMACFTYNSVFALSGPRTVANTAVDRRALQVRKNICVRHVTGNDQDYLRKIPRVVVQISALL